jgi:hypothetical protein
MKASLFCAACYMGAAPHDTRPLSGEYYSGDAAVRSMLTTFDQFRCADEFGFDWVTVSGSSSEAGEFAARNHIGRRNKPV